MHVMELSVSGRMRSLLVAPIGLVISGSLELELNLHRMRLQLHFCMNRIVRWRHPSSVQLCQKFGRGYVSRWLHDDLRLNRPHLKASKGKAKIRASKTPSS